MTVGGAQPERVLLSKHSARLAAVQIMHQMDILKDEKLENVVQKFVKYYLDGEKLHKNINIKFFDRLVSHFNNTVDFDQIINRDIVHNIHNTSSIALSIIKTAIIEMKFEKTDRPVIINEYVDISKEFLDKKSVSFVNAVLDKLSKCL